MRLITCTLLLLALATSTARATPLTICTKWQLVKLNRNLCGSIVDFTANHKGDHRFWSEALCSKRDMYVYLPPGYDPAQKYPLMIWLHGFIQDEKDFLELVPVFDRAIADGCMPPMIIAAPDGSIVGRPTIWNAGSFYINSKAGCFEDYLANDVWNFLATNFPIRPEAEAHVLAGASMGGYGAFNHGIKFRDRYKVVVGIMPPLNMRYLDCNGRYMTNFDPNCMGIQERYRPHSVIGVFYGVVHVQQKHLLDPLVGRDRASAVRTIARENPMEMLDAYDVKPKDLAMFIGYGGRDEFNIDAQVDSFVFHAKQRGIEPYVVFDPVGRHDTASGLKLMPYLAAWLMERLKPYAPPLQLSAP